MKNKFVYAACMILISAVLFADTKKYSITTHGQERNINLQFSREVFINNIYLDFMVPFGLERIFSDSDLVQLFSELYNDLSANYQKRLTVPVSSGRMLSISFKTVNAGDKMSLVAVSNYDMAEKKLVPDDGDFSGCYSREYIISNNILVPGHIYYLKDRDAVIKKFRETPDYNGLADYFLFDEDRSNDREIPGIIAAGLKKTPSGYNTCLLRLTEAQYYIFNGKFSNAEGSLGAAEKNVEAITDPEQKKFIQVSVKLMKRILYISRNIQQV